MGVFVGKAHDLVFDRGAIARAFAVDDAAVNRGEMEVVFDQLMGCRCGAGDVAAHLFAAGPGRWVKRKEAIGGIAWLCFQLVERNAAPINAGRGAGFEPIGVEAQLLQGVG